MTTHEKVTHGLGVLFRAIPQGKFRGVFLEAQEVETGINEMARMLSNVRQYFLDHTGEESPFVKKIDELVPRRK